MNSYYRLLGCHTVSFGSSLLMFQRSLSSFIKINGQTVYTDDGSISLLRNVRNLSPGCMTSYPGRHLIHRHHHRNRNFYKHRTFVTSKAEKQNVVLYHKLIAERDRNISKTM